MSRLPEIGVNVSRETIQRLEKFRDLTIKWNPSINLVAKNTIDDFWERHIMDSVQVFKFSNDIAKKWIDIGSGGGLPGVVIAVLARELQPELRVTLVESDQRKAVFLRTAVRELGLNVAVNASRVEALTIDHVDILSARALANLPKLFDLCLPFTNRQTKLLFLKGRSYEEEILQARKDWCFEVTKHQSITSEDSKILEVRGLKRAN